MKKILLYLTILPAVLVLVSCYWRPNSSTGGLSIDVSGIAPKAVGDVIRIYLIADGLLFSTGGGVPFAAEISAQDTPEKTISITGLPVGPTYKAMVGYGPVTGGFFYPQDWGESGLLTITPNTDTAVTVWIQPVSYPYGYILSYSSNLLGRQLTGIVEDDNGSMNAAEAGRLYFLSGVDVQNSLGLAYRANSLSRGIPMSTMGFVGTYLNTDQGIFPFVYSDSWEINTAFSTALGGSKDIRGSGSFDLSVGGYTDYAIFFRREGGLGGAYVAFNPGTYTYPAPASWSWVNRDVPGVTDMVVSENNAYYAAGGGIFALRPAYLQNPGLSANRVNLPAPAPVRSLGFRPSPGVPEGTLWLGTTAGAFQMTMDETSGAPVPSSATQDYPLSETSGDSIERIAINNSTGSHEAYLSRYYLYLVIYGSMYKLPFFAVFPGRATGMAWDSNFSPTLYISGSEGLAALYIGSGAF